jgi:hypothetical protein
MNWLMRPVQAAVSASLICEMIVKSGPEYCLQPCRLTGFEAFAAEAQSAGASASVKRNNFIGEL